MPVYLVTGVGRGLGTLSKNPENTVIGVARNAAAVKTRIQSDEVNALIFEADLTDQASLSRAVGNIESALGGAGIDVMINNAGYVSDTTALKSLAEFENDVQTAIDDTQKSIGVNVFGTLRAITTFLPLIQRGELKKVIAISSGMGDIEFINETQLPIAAPYAVSKAALTTLMAKFGAAYVDQGILFASICPGRVDTAEPGTSLSSDDITRLEKYGPKFESYSPGFKATAPEQAARSVMAAIERSSLAEGYSGSFLSHNGTKRWM